jgi:hypothetical protein
MTVGTVLEKSEEELLALRNFGEKSYFELKEKLISAGFPAPRTDSRHDGGAGDIAPSPSLSAPSSPAVASSLADDDDDDADEVGALGAALMEALKEAGRESD